MLHFIIFILNSLSKGTFDIKEGQIINQMALPSEIELSRSALFRHALALQVFQGLNDCEKFEHAVELVTSRLKLGVFASHVELIRVSRYCMLL